MIVYLLLQVLQRDAEKEHRHKQAAMAVTPASAFGALGVGDKAEIHS